MGFYQHPNAIVESEQIGDGTRVWAFTHILPGAKIGRNCNICDHTFIENDVTVGDGVTIKCGVQLWDGVHLEDGVFVGPNVSFTNDPFPRSRRPPAEFSRTLVREGASIGANATILPGLTIGRGAMVGAGAVVTMDVPANAIVTGNPARLDGYCSAAGPATATSDVANLVEAEAGEFALSVPGVRVMKMPIVKDLRGALTFAQFPDHLPFDPVRVFVVYEVPSSKIHGEHAHRSLEQYLVCLRGSVHVSVDDGMKRETIVLSGPGHGLYLPPMIWSTQFNYTPDAMLLVLASEQYDESEYVRDYEEYLELRSRSGADPEGRTVNKGRDDTAQ